MGDPRPQCRMILHKEGLDLNRHCKIVTREYVQAHDEPQFKNNNAPRSLDCIYLRPITSHQSGYEVLHLQTNRIINRLTLTPTTIIPSIMTQVYAISKADKVPDGLKIENKSNLILFDSSLIA